MFTILSRIGLSYFIGPDQHTDNLRSVRYRDNVAIDICEIHLNLYFTLAILAGFPCYNKLPTSTEQHYPFPSTSKDV